MPNKQIKLLKYVIDNYVRKERLPVFMIPNNSIHTIETPVEFYNLLLTGIRRSRQRVLISTLYLGSGDLERKLVDTLVETSNSNPQLQVKIVMDRNRGQRRDRKNQSSFTILKSALDRADNPQNFNISFVTHTRIPRRFDFLLNRRLSETVGTFHSKAVIFDDSVILTGANLSEDYFVYRKDRYVLFDDAKPLADFLEDFYDIFIDLGDKAKRGQDEPTVEFKNLDEYVDHAEQRFKLFKYIHRIADEELLEVDEYVAKYYECKLDPLLFKQSEFKGHTDEDVAILAKEEVQDVKHVGKELKNVLVVPIFQISILNYRYDQRLMHELLHQMAENQAAHISNLTFTTGYFNPTPHFLQLFKGIPHATKIQIVTGSPLTNSFHGARGFIGRIPAFYRYSLLKWVQALDENDNIRFYEYYKDKTTYHTKGFWYWHMNKDFSEYLTIYGSSNYARRSFDRDLEAQFLVFANSENAVKLFERDRMSVFEHKTEIDEKKIQDDTVTRVSFLNKVYHSLFKGFI